MLFAMVKHGLRVSQKRDSIEIDGRLTEKIIVIQKENVKGTWDLGSRSQRYAKIYSQSAAL